MDGQGPGHSLPVDESWMLQIARNVTDSQAGALHAKRYLIIDRDTKYSEQFRRLIRDPWPNSCTRKRRWDLSARAPWGDTKFLLPHSCMTVSFEFLDNTRFSY
jgi:hypothetical protein